MLRPPRIVALLLAAAAIGGLAAGALLVAGIDPTIRIGPFRLAVHDVSRPLGIGYAASFALLWHGWRSIVRRSFAWTLIAGLIVVTLRSLAIGAPAFAAKSDIAVTEFYVQLAQRGTLVDGPYSRFGWHHPGPLYFWIQVPFYSLSGDRAAGLYVGALAINLAAVAILAWVLVRIDRGALTVAILAGVLFFALRNDGLLASPWTAHVPVVPAMAFIVLAAATAAGHAWMLALVVMFASFIVQTHIAPLPMVSIVAIVALASVFAAARREPRLPIGRTVNASAWLLLVLWLPAIAEQLSHRPGNLTRLWRFFVSETDPTQSLTQTVASWSYALVGVLRPDFYTPHGGHFQPTYVAWALPASIVAMGLLFLIARRTEPRLEASIARMALIASIVELFSISRIRGEILDHEIFWIAGTGAINLAVLASAGVRVARERWRPSPRASPHPRLAVACAATIVVAIVIVGGRNFWRLVSVEASNTRVNATIVSAYESIRGYLEHEGVRRPLLRIAGDDWNVAAGTCVRLQRTGIPFAVEPDWLAMFTEQVAPDGGEDGVVTFGDAVSHMNAVKRPGNITVAESDRVFVDAIALKPGAM